MMTSSYHLRFFIPRREAESDEGLYVYEHSTMSSNSSTASRECYMISIKFKAKTWLQVNLVTNG